MEQTEIEDLKARISRLETMHLYGAVLLGGILIFVLFDKFKSKK